MCPSSRGVGASPARPVLRDRCEALMENEILLTRVRLVALHEKTALPLLILKTDNPFEFECRHKWSDPQKVNFSILRIVSGLGSQNSISGVHSCQGLSPLGGNSLFGFEPPQEHFSCCRIFTRPPNAVLSDQIWLLSVGRMLGSFQTDRRLVGCWFKRLATAENPRSPGSLLDWERRYWQVPSHRF